MEFLLIGGYWFLSGVLFIFFEILAFKKKQKSIRWIAGMFLVFLISLCLLFGAVVCFDSYFLAPCFLSKGLFFK
jgi:uncharacterized membrane protein